MRERLSLNRFLRSCLEEKIDFSRIRLRRKHMSDPWDSYFPEGELVKIVHDKYHRFLINKNGWNSKEGMGDCEVLSVSLTRKAVIVDVGRGWH